MRDKRERECNTRVKSVGGLSKEINYLGKDIDRDQDKARIYGAAFKSAEDEVCRHASNLFGVK